MALTTLDATTALVVIDLQKGIVSCTTVHPIATVLDNAARLAAAFREHRLPVVLVNVIGRAPGRAEAARPNVAPAADWAELVPELNQQPSDHLVSKSRWGAFIGTSLDADLRANGVTHVVLCGVSTSIGVESTARSASEYGYNVTLAVDAMTDTDPINHQHSVERIFPRLGETGMTADVLALLESTR